MLKKVVSGRFDSERFEGGQNMHSGGSDFRDRFKVTRFGKGGGGSLPSLAGF